MSTLTSHGFILGNTIGDVFLARVEKTPNLIGYRFKPMGPDGQATSHWRSLSFLDFYETASALAQGLMALGIRPEDRVIIASNTRVEWTLADFAILGCRAVTVPIYASNTPEDVAYIIQHSEARIAFVEDAIQLQKILSNRRELPLLEKIVVINPQALRIAPDHSDILTWNDLQSLGISEERRNSGQFRRNLREATPEELITICYTSGTTGVPKGVMLTHDNIMSVLEDCVSILHGELAAEKEQLVSFLPYSHIIGKCESLATHTFGWQLNFAESIENLIDAIGEVRPTMMFAVPRIFEKAHLRIRAMAAEGSRPKRAIFDWATQIGLEYSQKLRAKEQVSARERIAFSLADRLVFSKVRARFGGRLKFAVCGGAPLPREIGEFFGMAGISILEGYGLTETSAPVCLVTPEDVRFGTVGKPLPEVAIKIAEDGEILVRSRKVFKGYFKNPEATADCLMNGWFHTGDIGELDHEGFLRITDRKKDLIITSGGKNVAPQKIENLAKTLKFINQFVVHGDRRNYLTALVTLDRDAVMNHAKQDEILFSTYADLVKHPKIQALVQKSIDELNTHLASFETIKKFVILPEEFTVESGELTPSLKVKRKIINQRYQNEFNRLYAD